MPATRTTYSQTVKALRQLMAVPRDEREPHYRTAAEKIVCLRQQHMVDGLPDWSGTKSRDYRMTIQQAYREAGVPPDSEDTVQAALRYHVGNVVREVAPKTDLEALGLDKQGPRARMTREGPRRPRKPPKAAEVTPMPSILAEALEDPVGLVRYAIRSLETAKDLKPAGEQAETVRYMLRALWDAVDSLAGVVNQNHDAGL